MVDWTRLPGIAEGHRLRNIVVGIGYVILILVVIGAVAPGDEGTAAPAAGGGDGGDVATTEPPTTPEATPTATVAPTATATVAPTETATPPPEPAVQEYSGSGGDVTDEASVEGGFTTLSFTHSGEANFQVELVDAETGETEEFLVNAIGDYDGTVGLYVPEGDYLLDINADGDWEAIVEQPRFGPGDVQDPPVQASGEQADWMGPINFDGAVEVTVEASGEGHLGVWLANIHGERVDLLANDVAPYETSTVVGESGEGLLLIESDQAGWRIEVTR